MKLVGPYKAGAYGFEVSRLATALKLSQRLTLTCRTGPCTCSQVFECVRDVALVGIPVFFFSGEMSQLVLGLLLAGISMMCLTAISPYRHTSDTNVAIAANICIFCTMLSGIILKYNAAQQVRGEPLGQPTNSFHDP